ncbi:TPA: hypothetical protein DIV45_01595 [Patescibacteria group bacterium]|uniref:Uncharacterized protein n=1 Tax=candidate division Kazan bacterium GW2011_GWA1_44_22 TaxID=1620410 RepID=A0A0G1I2P6_UNCK3|nr:MAG: hypothetical protein VE96_C0003G0028 [candidate division Kazan bacterium GW2011_GWA1_44_22]HCR42042.1 hypothetical protein [Patescibacteria group bacterium]
MDKKAIPKAPPRQCRPRGPFWDPYPSRGSTTTLGGDVPGLQAEIDHLNRISKTERDESQEDD